MMGWNPVKDAEDTGQAAASGNVGGAIYGAAKTVNPAISGAWQTAQPQIANAFGQNHQKQDDLNDQSAAASQQSLAAKRGILTGMQGTDQDYLKTQAQQLGTYRDSSNANRNQYLDQLNQTATEAANQGKSAEATYSNEIQPRLKSQMEDAQKEAAGAMTLADASDPNNKVHQAVENKYNTLAGGVQKQGLADYGVLAALGNQATSNTMGAAGGPMTGSQMGMLAANNSRNASQAYNIAAQRMNALKQQGIDTGFSESDKAYSRGQQAKDRYSGTVGNFETGMNNDINRQNEFRDRGMGYASDRMGVGNQISQTNYDTGMAEANAKYGMGSAEANRELGYQNDVAGNTQAGIANQMAAANAQNAQQAGIMGGVINAAGVGIGAYSGGASGAAAGGQAANGISRGMAGGYQQPYQQPNQQYQGSYV